MAGGIYEFTEPRIILFDPKPMKDGFCDAPMSDKMPSSSSIAHDRYGVVHFTSMAKRRLAC